MTEKSKISLFTKLISIKKEWMMINYKNLLIKDTNKLNNRKRCKQIPKIVRRLKNITQISKTICKPQKTVTNQKT